jgi:hypothetical protein
MASLNQIGFEALSVPGTAVGLTGVAGKRPKHALIRVGGTAGTDDVRWRADGTDPTTTVGELVPSGSYIDWTDMTNDSDYFGLISRARFIRASGAGPTTLDVVYFD